MSDSKSALGITLNVDQTRAMAEIKASIASRDNHVLSGSAGSGKTTLMQVLAAEYAQRGLVLSAPTHKAVAVLSRKLRAAGVDVPCMTIHSLLSLRPRVEGHRQVFERMRRAKPVVAQIVVVDEASMVGSDLMAHIRNYLSHCVVIFVGDPAQLPPVGEKSSEAFDTTRKSHLHTIVRQDAGNPILDAADIVRQSQGGKANWDWCKSAMAKPRGVYAPGDRADAWLHKAFTSADFKADPDTFRYLAWTNARVADVNSKVRRWLYGNNIPTPFVPGERALLRAPVIIDDEILLHTNEEAEIITIARGDKTVLNGEAVIPSWHIVLRSDEGLEVAIDAVRDEAIYQRVIERLVREKDWRAYHEVKGELAQLQSIYALTIHNSQGSTLKNVFLDVGEIRRWSRSDLLESQRAAYVGVTRATHALILVGA
jgi:hypothetical protein